MFFVHHKFIVILLNVMVIFLALSSFANAQDNGDLQPVYPDAGSSHTETVQTLVAPPENALFVMPDANGNGTLENPFGSIQTAINAANPGDTVYLLAGDYYEGIETVRDGTAESRITIAGDTGAILRGASSRGRIFQVFHDYITVEGFTINGYDRRGNRMSDYRDKLLYVVAAEGSVRQGPEYFTVRNMRFLNAGGECLRLKYFVKFAQIYLNHFDNCGVYDYAFNDGGKNGESIYVGTADDQWEDNEDEYGLTDDPDASNENWIFKNTFNTRGNECIEFKEGAEQNVAYDNYCTGQLDPDAAGLASRGNYNVFRNNTVFGNVGAGIRVGGDNNRGGYGHQIYRNKIYGNDYGGIKFQDHPQGSFVCENDFSQGQTRPSAGSYDDEYETLVSAACSPSVLDSYGYQNAPDDTINYEHLGDANCSQTVDALDALLVLQYVVELRSEAPCPLALPEAQIDLTRVDVNQDNQVTAVDALLILQCSVGIPNVFCPSGS